MPASPGATLYLFLTTNSSPIMASPVDVCNIALAHFGQEKINALDAEEAQTNENAAKCLTYFQQAKEELLESQNWTFGRVRSTLSQILPVPAFDWLYQHAKPSDCAKIIEVRAGTPAVAPSRRATFRSTAPAAVLPSPWTAVLTVMRPMTQLAHSAGWRMPTVSA